MNASLRSVADVLSTPRTQFLIPIFQRVYSWTRMQARQLYTDVMDASLNQEQHFVGTLIARPEKELPSESGLDTRVERASLIDGQQRLTTVLLMILAARDEAVATGDHKLAEELNERYLYAALGEGASSVEKIVLSSDDAPTLRHLLSGSAFAPDAEPSQFMMENYRAFRESVRSSRSGVSSLLKGLESLIVVYVELGSDDMPQQVFESLNTKGRPLTTIDLLRNSLISQYGFEEQEHMLDRYWMPIDDAFSKFGAEKDLYIDAALHRWITKVSPGINLPNRNGLYQAFKSYIESRRGALEDMLLSIHVECLDFASNSDSREMKVHIDWAMGTPMGSMAQKKLFGD